MALPARARMFVFITNCIPSKKHAPYKNKCPLLRLTVCIFVTHSNVGSNVTLETYSVRYSQGKNGTEAVFKTIPYTRGGQLWPWNATVSLQF